MLFAIRINSSPAASKPIERSRPEEWKAMVHSEKGTLIYDARNCSGQNVLTAAASAMTPARNRPGRRNVPARGAPTPRMISPRTPRPVGDRSNGGGLHSEGPSARSRDRAEGDLRVSPEASLKCGCASGEMLLLTWLLHLLCGPPACLEQTARIEIVPVTAQAAAAGTRTSTGRESRQWRCR